jgi:hypothetical protein
MNSDDRREVTAYLDGGGKLLYTSPRAAAALGEAPGATNPLATGDMADFLAQYFGARYLDTLQVGGGDVIGLGDIIGADRRPMDVFYGRPLQDVFALAQYGGENPASIGTATKVAGWEKGGDGALMGVRVDGNAAHGSFQTVFFGFNLNQLTQTDDVIEVVQGALDNFGVATGTYTVDTPEPVLYHAQVLNRVSGIDTPIKAISLGGDSTPVTLSYRHHGIGDYVVSTLSPGDHAGSFQGTIPGSAVTPDGVDYFLKAGTASTYDPRLARDGSLAHAIGVALPEVSASPARTCPAGQVPDPGFEDTAGNTHEANIDCIAWYTITLGAGDRNGNGENEYAPDEGVTRGQMASFLARTAVEAGVTLPANAPDAFPDDDDSVHQDNINAIAALGIAQGRDGLFHPEENVSRAQMASFIARLYDLVTGNLPKDAPNAFPDDEGSTHEPSINALAELGVVKGRADTADFDGDGNVGELVYGPNDNVTRAQMASFIIRTLDLFIDSNDAFAGGADVRLDDVQYSAGDDVSGVLLSNKDVQSFTVSGCGIDETPVETDDAGAFTVALPASAPAGDCELAFTIVTLRPGAEEGAPTQTVTHTALIGIAG